MGDAELLYQNRFDVVTTSDSAVFAIDRPEILFTNDLVPSPETLHVPRISTTVSEVEVFNRYFRTGQLPESSPDKDLNLQLASLRGQTLHDADTLFSLITHAQTGSEIYHGLPTASTDTIAKFYPLIADLYLSYTATTDEAVAVFITAWNRYFHDPNRSLTANLAL